MCTVLYYCVANAAVHMATYFLKVFISIKKHSCYSEINRSHREKKSHRQNSASNEKRNYPREPLRQTTIKKSSEKINEKC
jgi:hypothetical protein